MRGRELAVVQSLLKGARCVEFGGAIVGVVVGRSAMEDMLGS
jgi:hypothetical protein